MNMYDYFPVASDGFRESFVSRRFPKRVENGGMHGGSSRPEPRFGDLTSNWLLRHHPRTWSMTGNTEVYRSKPTKRPRACSNQDVWLRDAAVSLLFFSVACPVVLVEQVLTEVAGEVAPNRVDVVSVVLRVIQFDEEGRSLNAVIMWVAAVDTARPGEIDIPADTVDLRDPAFG